MHISVFRPKQAETTSPTPGNATHTSTCRQSKPPSLTATGLYIHLSMTHRMRRMHLIHMHNYVYRSKQTEPRHPRPGTQRSRTEPRHADPARPDPSTDEIQTPTSPWCPTPYPQRRLAHGTNPDRFLHDVGAPPPSKRRTAEPGPPPQVSLAYTL